MNKASTGTEDVEELNTCPVVIEERTDPADERERNASVYHVKQ